MRLSRRAVLVGVAGSAAMGLAGTEGARARDAITYPPGCRLGIAVPPSLEPHVLEGAYTFVSPDGTFEAELYEPPAFGDALDADTWNLRPRDFELVREWETGPDERRRLFVDPPTDAQEDYGWRTLLVRRPGWIAQLDLRTSDAMRRGGRQIERWRETGDAIIASAHVRGPVSVDRFMAEHGIAADLDRLNPRHFGRKLIVSPRAPDGPREAWTMDDYVAMEKLPASIEEEFVAEIIEAEAAIAERRWSQNGIEWLARAPLDIPLNAGRAMRTRTVLGYGSNRHVEWTSYSETDADATAAALERVLDTFSFVPPVTPVDG